MSSIIKSILQTALLDIETNGWWDGKQSPCPNDSQCAVTAIFDATNSREQRHAAEDHLMSCLSEKPAGVLGCTALVDFNDSHTEDEVKALFRKAIEVLP